MFSSEQLSGPVAHTLLPSESSQNCMPFKYERRREASVRLRHTRSRGSPDSPKSGLEYVSSSGATGASLPAWRETPMWTRKWGQPKLASAEISPGMGRLEWRDNPKTE